MAHGYIASNGMLEGGWRCARRLNFEVLRNGRPIGSHVVSFEQAGPKLEVRVAVDLRWSCGTTATASGRSCAR